MMKRFYSFLFCLCVSGFAFSQSFFVKATIDSTLLLIGEQTKMTFEVTQPKDLMVQMPIFSDTIVSGLEIVERLKADTLALANKENIQITQSYVVTSFDSALYYIPEFDFVATDTVKSNPLSLKVLSVPVDTTQHAVTDIKPVYNPPIDWMFWLRILISIILVAVLVFVIVFYVRRWKHRQKTDAPKEDQGPKRPAHEIAIEQLTELKLEKLWQQDKVKEYHTQLVDILRTYIENRFAVSATEQTSMELLEEISLFCPHDASCDMLKRILMLADLVKFAKWSPLPQENDKSMSDAFAFVEATKEQPTESAAASEKKADEEVKKESTK